MENQYKSEELFEVAVDSTSKSLIRDIALWARIIAITAFVSYGVSLIVSFFGNNALENSISGGVTGKGTRITGALIGAIIGVIITLFLFRFSKEAKNAIDGINQGQLETGFNNLRIYFKILGIIIIIFLVIFLLALFFGVLGTMVRSNG